MNWNQGQNWGGKLGDWIIYVRVEGVLVQRCLLVKRVGSGWSRYSLNVVLVEFDDWLPLVT